MDWDAKLEDDDEFNDCIVLEVYLTVKDQSLIFLDKKDNISLTNWHERENLEVQDAS